MRMKSARSLLALLAGSAVGVSAHAAECRFDRTLPVPSNGSLDAYSGSGNVKVIPGDGPSVHVSGRVRASTGWLSGNGQADVQRVCDHPPIEQDGSMVRVGQVHEDWLHGVSVDYTIEVPRAFAVTAKSGSGDLDLESLAGSVMGHTGSGNIHALQLRGAKLESSSGTIEADSLSGDTRLNSSSGNITARFAGAASVDAGTSSGSVHLENVNGAVRAHTSSGDVNVSGRPEAPWEVQSASGSVHLHTQGGSNFQLRANAASGSLDVALPLNSQNRDGRNNLQAQVGSGGPEVRIGTSSGNIRID